MTEYMIWIWLALFVIAAAFEFATLDFVSIWFAIAAIPSFILSLISVDPMIQVFVFVGIALFLLLFTRPLMLKHLKTNEIKTNVDSMVGTTGVVIARITPDTIGRVRVRSTEWSAIAKESIDVDEHVRVLDIEGVKLIVEKIEKV